jgi:hypothetical protein
MRIEKMNELVLANTGQDMVHAPNDGIKLRVAV